MICVRVCVHARLFAIVCVCVCSLVCLCVFICWRDFVDVRGCACCLGLAARHASTQRRGASGVTCRVLSLVAACYS